MSVTCVLVLFVLLDYKGRWSVAGGIWAISISFIQFCCEIKPALKNKVFQKKKVKFIVYREESMLRITI